MLQQDIPNTVPVHGKSAADYRHDASLGDTTSFFARATASLGTKMEIKRGEHLHLPATSDTIVFIRSGATKLIAKASGDRNQIVAFHFEGDLVSISAPDMHVYWLEALRDAKVVTFPAQALLDASETNPKFMKSILLRSLVSLFRCRDKALGLGRKTAQERLASFFLAMAERIGNTSDGKCDLELPMSRGDIADSLGLTIETVSRQFSELRNAGLIETDGRFHVTLQDLPTLAARSGRF